MLRPTAFAHLLPFFVPLISGAAIHSQARDAPSFLPHVTSLQYSGTGCPSSNPRVDETGAWNDLAFRFNGFEVTTTTPNSRNVSSAPAARTANCEVHLHVAGCQAGWQVAVHDVDVRGHLVLDPGAALDFYVQSYWSEKADDTITVHGAVENTAGGRVDSTAAAHATIPDDQLRWSPCGAGDAEIGILNVNFRTVLRAGSGNPYGYFGGAPTEKWDFIWRRC